MKTSLTKSEKKFLKALARMEKKQEPFTYRKIAELAGWKSVQMAFQTCDKLKLKGLLEDGARLALVDCPVTTNAGLAAIGAV